jgi:hypothetical protein
MLEQCHVEGDIVASRILWDNEPVAITANEALAAEAAGTESRTDGLWREKVAQTDPSGENISRKRGASRASFALAVMAAIAAAAPPFSRIVPCSWPPQLRLSGSQP